MTSVPLLDWALLSVSLFNTITLFWLAVTILLNAARRAWGVWLVGGGLLAGAIFFVSHTAILGMGRNVFDADVEFWWRFGWPPLILLPLSWNVATLWFTGYWESGQTSSPTRRIGLAATLAFAALLVILLLFADPLPSFGQLALLNLFNPLSIAGVPVIIIALPLYILLCIGLSVINLQTPAPAPAIGQDARRRARPWLVAASISLLTISLLVTALIFYVVLQARTAGLRPALEGLVAWADLTISALVSAAILFVGQAVVAYEVFSGAILPRRGLARGWRRVIILAAGYGIATGAALALDLHPIYGLLTTALLMTLFFALLLWRSFQERERLLAQLAPFVASQGVYNQMVNASPFDQAQGKPREPGTPAFSALCEEILGANLGYLIPTGPLAQLAGASAFPEGAVSPSLDLIPPFFPDDWFCRIDPPLHAGAVWAVRLKGGLLLLGDKQDGGLYALEELEVARAAAERLLDTAASAELARRLVDLQRQRLAATQVADRRTRRALHDDILPQLHTVLLSLPPGTEAAQPLAELHRQIADLLREMPAATAPEFARTGMLAALRLVAEGELAGAFDSVDWQVAPEVEEAARRLPALSAEVAFHAAREAMRNAARHARGETPLHLTISAESGDELWIAIEDNGLGLPPENQPGSGMALHGTLLAVVGGRWESGARVGGGTVVRITLPAG